MAFIYDSLEEDEHGGGCCGITHLHEFPNRGSNSISACVEFVQNSVDNGLVSAHNDLGWIAKEKIKAKDMRHLFEVVLSETQIEEWRDAVEDCDFVEVNSFLNTKSGKRCHVFHLETNRPESEK